MIRLPDGSKKSVDEAATALGGYWKRNTAVWDLFESRLDCDRDVFEPLDVLSLNALNTQMSMRVMTPFWCGNRDEWQNLLRKVPTGDVTEMSEDEISEAARTLGEVADAIHKVDQWGGGTGRGGTRIGKLLYRMRPRLAPIWDNHVGSYYPGFESKPWAEWYSVAMKQIHSNADPLREAVAACDKPFCRISPVRAWDIVLWWSRV